MREREQRKREKAAAKDPEGKIPPEKKWQKAARRDARDLTLPGIAEYMCGGPLHERCSLCPPLPADNEDAHNNEGAQNAENVVEVVAVAAVEVNLQVNVKQGAGSSSAVQVLNGENAKMKGL